MPQIYRQVVADGDTFQVPIKVCGDQFVSCFNAQLAFTIPAGIRLIGPLTSPTSNIIDVPKGTYNNGSDIWFIGDLIAGECVDASFEFVVDDITLANSTDNRFFIPLTLTTSCSETVISDNVLTIVVSVVPECNQGDLSIGSKVVHATGGGGANLSIG